MSTTYRYQAFLWTNRDGLHSGRLLDDNSDGTATANTRREVISQLKEYLAFVHANEDEYYVPYPEFTEPQMRKVKLRLHPEYRDDRRTYACKESVYLELPCALGKRPGSLYSAILPTIDVEFNFSDLRSFGKLAAHYVQSNLGGKTPRELSRDLAPAQAELVEIVVSAKTKKRSDRWEPDLTNLTAVASHATSREYKRITRTWERESEAKQVATILSEEGTSLCLVGNSGCGKTSVLIEAARMVEAQRAANLPAGEPRPKVFWITSAAHMIAGMRFLGQWQERCEMAIDELSRVRGVLCFESLHDLFRLGGSSPESSIAAFLSPFLKAGELRIVVEATTSELEACDRLLPGFIDQLQVFELPPFDEARASRLLRRAAEAITRDEQVVFPQGSAEEVNQLFRRFQPYEAFPGKVIQFMREVTTRCAEENPGGEVSVDVIKDQFSKSTGLPELILDDGVTLTKQEIGDELSRSILGQPAAVGAIADLLVKFKAGMNDPKRPLGVFLFTGPTGVGKTAVVRALGDLLFGERPEKERLIRLDMSEYADYDAAVRLLGNPFGEPSDLVRRIRANPFTILLLDEVEKASDDVFDVFLNVFEEARLTDAFGRVTSFNSAIIIMTSNLGAKSSGSLGFGSGGEAEAMEAARTDPSAAINFFRPEFFNRLDRSVVFEPLRYETIVAITRKELADLARREGIAARGLTLRWDENLVEHLAATGFDPKYGARPLQRKIEEMVIVPMARFLVENSEIENREIAVEKVDDAVKCSLV